MQKPPLFGTKEKRRLDGRLAIELSKEILGEKHADW